MKTFLRMSLAGIGLILIFFGVCGIVLFTQIDQIASMAFGNALSNVFTAPVTIGSVRVSFLDQTIEFSDFVLANPKPFKEGAAIECERLIIEPDLRTLLSGTPVIRRVLMEGTKLNYLYSFRNGTNIGTLARQASLSESGPNAGSRASFVIKELRCEKVKVQIRTGILPMPILRLRMVDVRLENIGNGDEVTTGHVASVLLRSLIMETLTIRGLFAPLQGLLRKEMGDKSPPKNSFENLMIEKGPSGDLTEGGASP